MQSSALGMSSDLMCTYMSNFELNTFISDAIFLVKAVFSSKRLLISANSESCAADDFVQDD